MVSLEHLRGIPLLTRLDPVELEVLASQVDLRTYQPRERIFGIGEVAEAIYLVVSGSVCVTTVDEENQEVLIAQRGPGTLMGCPRCWTKAFARPEPSPPRKPAAWN